MSQEETGGINGEILAQATAIARRSYEEDKIRSRIHSHISVTIADRQPVDPGDNFEEIVNRTAFLLKRLENPSAPLSLVEKMTWHLPSDPSDETANSSLDEDTQMQPHQIKDLHVAMSDDLQEMIGFTDEEIGENSAKTYIAAKQIASDRGIDIVKVYEDDELYVMALRSAFPIQELSEDFVRVFEPFRGNLLRIIEKHATNPSPELLDGEEDEEDLRIRLQKMVDQPEFKERAEIGINIAQELLRQLFLYNLVSTWGKQALDELPQDVLEKCMPHQPLAPDLLRLLN